MRSRKDFGAVVPPRSGDDLDAMALRVREVLGLKEEAFFPILEVYDLLHELIPGAAYEVLPMEAMGDNHGLTLVRRKLIQIREDVFEDACRHDGRGRFTMCHEMGHLLLHREGVALQRSQERPPLYKSSEWQSDRFSGSLLMPLNLLSPGENPASLMEKFGVSLMAAEVRMSQIDKKKGAAKQAS